MTLHIARTPRTGTRTGRRYHLTALVAVVALAAGSWIAISSSATASTPPTAGAFHATTAAGGHATVLRSYSHGQISVQMTITNSSDQVWTLDPSETMHSGGHWAQQAATTLQPGAQTTVSAYTDNPSDWVGWWIIVSYQIPDGHFAVFQALLGNVLPNGIDGGWATSVNAQQPSANWIAACPVASGSIGHGYHPSGQIGLGTCSAA